MSVTETVTSPAWLREWHASIHTRTDTAALVAGLLCLFDGLMTVPHWHLEGNPVVLQLGPAAMLAVKAFGVLAILGLWFGSVKGSHVEGYGKPFVWVLTVLYVVVVGTNLWVLAA